MVGALRARYDRRGVLILFGLFAVAAISGVARWYASTGLDPFEDGYQHWWIASNLAETGEFWDRHSKMTEGNWLPLYDFFAGGVLLVAGTHNIAVLKAANVILSLGTLGITYVLGRRWTVSVGTMAFAFLAFNPIDIAISGYSVADPLGVFALYAAILALTSQRGSERAAYATAAIGMLVAAATRYEAWVVALLLLAYARFIGFPRVQLRKVLLILAPAAAFVAFWLAWTAQFGFLPSIVVQQTSTDVRYKVERGLQPAIEVVLQRYWEVVLAYVFPVVAVGGAYAVVKTRRDIFALIAVLFWGLVSLYIVLRVGQPSPRYILVTFPAISLLAARAADQLHRRLRQLKWSSHVTKSGLPTKAIAMGVAAAILVPLAMQTEGALLTPPRPIGFLMQPMERAGRWLASQPVEPTRVLLSESPIAAYYGGWPASRMLGSRWLPQERNASLSFIHERVGYIVYMGVPYYSLRLLFPELQSGQSLTLQNVRFDMVYDANGPETEFGAHLVFVYRVVPL